MTRLSAMVTCDAKVSCYNALNSNGHRLLESAIVCHAKWQWSQGRQCTMGFCFIALSYFTLQYDGFISYKGPDGPFDTNGRM